MIGRRRFVALGTAALGTSSLLVSSSAVSAPTAGLSRKSVRCEIQEIPGILTPRVRHFVRSHADVPSLGPEHRFLVHGLVRRSIWLGLADLIRLPRRSLISLIECAGNGFKALGSRARRLSVGDIDGMLSTNEWVGVPLSSILDIVDASIEAGWILVEGADRCRYLRSIPLKLALDQAIIAYGQNGETLRPEQGFPFRLLVPSLEGGVDVKWLRRLELSATPALSRDDVVKYSLRSLDGLRLSYGLKMGPKSIITQPSFPAKLTHGWYSIAGLAWSGFGGVRAVDISFDRGESWKPANVMQSYGSDAPARFEYLWEWDGKPTTIMSRAVDIAGNVQPSVQEFCRRRGTRPSYHLNSIREWEVQADGKVLFYR
jgi:sulfane dehydrogenase subunit SoxC